MPTMGSNRKTVCNWERSKVAVGEGILNRGWLSKLASRTDVRDHHFWELGNYDIHLAEQRDN